MRKQSVRRIRRSLPGGKRPAAAVLCLVMLFSLLGAAPGRGVWGDARQSIYALVETGDGAEEAPGDDGAESAGEAPAEEQTEQTGEAPAEEQTEHAGEAPGEDTETDAGEPAEDAENAAQDGPAPEENDVPAEAPEDEQPAEPEERQTLFFYSDDEEDDEDAPDGEVGEQLAEPDSPAEPEEAAAPYLEAELDGVKIIVETGDEPLPPGATLTAELVEDEAVITAIGDAAVEELMENAGEDTVVEEVEVLEVRAVALTIHDADGEVFVPETMQVTMISELAAEAEEAPVVVLVDGDGETTIAEAELAESPAEDMETDGDEDAPDETTPEETVPEENTPEETVPEETEREKEEDTAPLETELRFEAEAGAAVCAIVTTRTLSKDIITAEGETYTVTVTYGPEAGIPDGAELRAEELLEHREYQEYFHEASEALASDIGTVAISAARFFDISIVYRGAAVEPLAPVDVRISCADALAVPEEESLVVVHFAESGAEVLPAAADEEELLEGAVSEVTFAADSFSIYSILSAGSTTDLDGRSFAIVNIQTGAQTGAAFAGEQMTAAKLRAASVTVTDGAYTRNLSGGEDVAFWRFDSAGETNKYYISTETDAGTRYLNISGSGNSGSITLSDTPQAIYVQTDAGGHPNRVRLTNKTSASSGGTAVNLYSGTVNNGFGAWNDSGNNEWMTLFELEVYELAPAFTGRMVSVSELTESDGVMIYNSVWNDYTGQYDYYVIAGDGSLVRAFDNGDTIAYRSKISAEWKLIIYTDEATGQPNGYYEFYNEETGKYLAPQSGSVLSDTPLGVTLNGRRSGAYSSTIEGWDSEAWAWYGLRFGDGLEPGAGASSAAFLFARAEEPAEGVLTEVETIDSAAMGIKIQMYDFPSRSYMSNLVGNDAYTNGNPGSGLVRPVLGKSGFPITAGGTDLAKMFSSQYYIGEGNHLFLASIYNATGRFEYSAFDNFAHYNAADGTFTVYDQLGTPDGTASQFYYKRGNFFPFNSLNPSKPAANRNEYNGYGRELSIEDPANEGTLYTFNEAVDFYFGMTIETGFMQPRDGEDDRGNPTVYEFNGDDDLWLFIDGVLVLDIGGIHDAIPGSINFQTGDITINGAVKTNIRERFRAAGIFPDGSPWSDGRAGEYFAGNTFVDYSTHAMKMFYMERGAGASNLQMSFNLPVVELGRFAVEKTLTGTDQQEYANVEFAFQAFQKAGGEDILLTRAVYERTGAAVTFYNGVEIDGALYNGVFYLKPGEAAVFDVENENVVYYAQELGVDRGAYQAVQVNETDVLRNGTDETDSAGAALARSSENSVKNRARVNFANACSTDNLRALRITKALDGLPAGDDAAFEFRVLLESTDGRLVYYDQGTYYIQDSEGCYCQYVEGELTRCPEGEKTAYKAGTTGTIAGIPAGYTVVIENLLAGTEFYVEEIRFPDNYRQTGKTVDGETCETENLIEGADGRIALGKDAEVTITNRALRDIEVVKQWNAPGWLTNHGTVTVALFRVGEDGSLTPVEGEDGVRTIAAPDTTAHFYLDQDEALGDYTVREVVLTEDGMRVLEEGAWFVLAGETRLTDGGEQTCGGLYQVSYETGEAAEEAFFRRDVVVNTMPEVMFLKTNPNDIPLADAEFTLAAAGSEAAYVSDGNGVILREYLTAGEYTLTETRAPDGFNQLTEPITVTVDENGVRARLGGDELENIASEGDPAFVFRLRNDAFVALPRTGGGGTGLFALAGAALICGAAALLAVLTRRRRGRA